MEGPLAKSLGGCKMPFQAARAGSPIKKEPATRSAGRCYAMSWSPACRRLQAEQLYWWGEVHCALRDPPLASGTPTHFPFSQGGARNFVLTIGREWVSVRLRQSHHVLRMAAQLLTELRLKYFALSNDICRSCQCRRREGVTTSCAVRRVQHRVNVGGKINALVLERLPFMM